MKEKQIAKEDIAQELSMTEKRVLLALSRLKGEGTPTQVQDAMMPDSIAKLSKKLRGGLALAFEGTGHAAGENQISVIIEQLLTDCLIEDAKEAQAKTVSIMISNLTSNVLSMDVPLQKGVLGKVLGDCVPAVLSSLTEIKAEAGGARQGFISQVEIMNSCSWLRAKGLVEISEQLERYYSLSSKRGSTQELPERRALKVMKKHHGAVSVDELRKDKKFRSEEVPVALGWLKKKNWARIEKRGNDTVLEITEEGKQFLGKKGEDEELIETLADKEVHESSLNLGLVEKLKKRQEILKEREVVVRKIILTDAGRKVAGSGLDLAEEVSQLTPQMIQTGSWKDKALRRYDINMFAPMKSGGRTHPLQQYIEKARRIFIEMGFEEIETGFVQGAFWNMDALFTAQDHPVREIQDTLYLSQPARIALPDAKIVGKVREMHEHGDEESDGWRYKWSEKEAERAMLRTHTTVNTIRYLAAHPEPPVKVFSIGRTFRKEAIDSTHLPEFIQVEGIVMEEGANLAMLVGLLKEFYRRMGIEDIRIRPGYFPYTEPSLEPEIFFKGKWMELGGAGIFRPEVTKPFGVKHPVLAWGLGLERLAMALLNVDDIRKLYVSDIDWLRSTPIIR